MTNLPPSWQESVLGAVVEYGKTNKVEPDEIVEDTWVLELEDIEKDTSSLLARVANRDRKSKSTKNRFEAGDVLYGKLRPYLNKVLIADSPGVCTTEIIPIDGRGFIDNRFLFYWLKHPRFLDYVNAVSHGVNMPRLGTEAGSAAPIIVAPLPEQKRIADKLDSVLARVDACRERLDRLPALIKRFRQSILAAATSGRLTEDWRASRSSSDAGLSSVESDWSGLTVGDVTLDLRYGTSQKCDYREQGKSVLRIPNMGDAGQIDLADIKRADFTAAEIAKLELRAGDLLLIRSNGSVDLVGKCCIVERCAEGYLFAGYLMRLRVDVHRVLPRYVFYSLSAPEQRQRIELISKSTSGVNNINSEEVRSLPLLAPPIAEQHEIVRRVETLFAFADRLEARYAAASRQVGQLTPALLAKAFRGELVPQDPADEPAAELLERLAATRSDASKTRRGRKATA